MFAPLIEKLQRRQDLTTAEAAAAMDDIMEGRAKPAHIAGHLTSNFWNGARAVQFRICDAAEAV